MNTPKNVPSAQTPLLDLDLLRTFVAIVDCGSFAAAAEAVFRTPSAVSMQMKKLEEMIGRPVLKRDSRSVSLTRDGELLLADARKILSLNRDILARFICPDLTGEVRLGAPDDVSERFLPIMLRRFAESHPGVTVNVVVDSSKSLCAAVDSGHLDLAIYTCEACGDGPGEADILMRERLVWAMLKSGVAVMQDPLPVSVWDEACAWRNMGLGALDAAGRAYRIAFQSAHISGQRAAILADLAIAPLPVSALTPDIVDASLQHDLPKLQDYALGLTVREDASAPVLAAADHLRASFATAQSSRTFSYAA